MTIQRLWTFLPPLPGQRTASRSITSLTLLLLVVMGLPALSSAQVCPPDGDVDRNGSVTAADALLAFQQALGLAQLTACQQTIANVFPQPNAPDANITASDALCIFQKALSLPSCLDALPSTNLPPVADAGLEQIVFANDLVTLSGSGSDSDGTIVRYHWVQTSGPPVALSGADTPNASFTAPEVALETFVEELAFQLTVTDDDGASDTAVVFVAVFFGSATNEPPSANAGPGKTVSEGTLVTLSGSGTDSDGFIIAYNWLQTSGTPVELIDGDTPNPSFFAPEVDSDEELVFELVVFDDEFGFALDTVTITVLNAVSNTPPLADAGRDQTVDADAPVTLSGSGTDSDGTIVSYRWTQTSGTPVTLTGAETRNAGFIAPEVESSVTLTFRLTVTDDEDATASDDVMVVILPVERLTLSVSGTVKNYYTGEVIPQAAVWVRQYDNGTSRDLGTANTDDDGSYEIQVAAGPGRIIVSADAEHYAPQSAIVNVTEDTDNASTDLDSLPVDVVHEFRPADDVEIRNEDHVLVSVTGGSLATKNGGAPAGNVTAMVTVLDASTDPAVMPGDFMALDQDTGMSEPIESFGAINVRFVDENDEPLDLRAGQEAGLSIPLAQAKDPADAPATMPMFYWSDELGHWIEDGNATLEQVAPGKWAYVGNVGHFTTWNADAPYPSVWIRGCVVDEMGEPVHGAVVTAEGRDYIGSTTTTTAFDGRFELEARPESEVLLSVQTYELTIERTIATGSEALELGQCLELLPPDPPTTPDQGNGEFPEWTIVWDMASPAGDIHWRVEEFNLTAMASGGYDHDELSRRFNYAEPSLDFYPHGNQSESDRCLALVQFPDTDNPGDTYYDGPTVDIGWGISQETARADAIRSCGRNATLYKCDSPITAVYRCW